MCGIIGVVEPAAEGRKANLEKACALMRHRGPDDTGLRSWLGRRPDGYQRGLLKRPALLAAAGQGTAEQAFVYDRAFRRYRGLAYTPQFQRQLAGWHPDVLYREAWERGW